MMLSIQSCGVRHIPKMHGRIGPPRAPGMGHLQQPARGRLTGALAQAEIAVRKSIGPAHGPHGNVMGGPLTDAGQLAQAPYAGLGVRAWLKRERARGESPSQRQNGLRTRTDDAERGYIIASGLGNSLG